MTRQIISEFRGQYGFLSNFHHHPVTRKGVTYPTNEHLFNARKTADWRVRAWIAEAPTPQEAKNRGRSARTVLRPGWDELVRYEVMLEGLTLKFADPALYAALRDTGDALLVEGTTWDDRTWGYCTCGNRVCTVPGQNWLGRMLMYLRDYGPPSDIRKAVREIRSWPGAQPPPGAGHPGWDVGRGLYILAGTGSRSLQVADKATWARAIAEVRAAVTKMLEAYGNQLVIMSGMAEGFDALLAWTATELGVPLWCAIPHRDYGNYYWSEEQSLLGRDRRREFHAYLEKARWVTYVMEDIYRTSSLYRNGVHANFVRNAWMVEQANAFLVWNPASRGTKDCFERIDRVGLPFEDLSKPLRVPQPQ